MTKVVLAIPNENDEADLRSLLSEVGDLNVVGVTRTTTALPEYVARFEPDLVLIHDGIGPEPVTQVIRDLGLRRPGMAMIQISRDGGSATVIRALEAGARAVINQPFAFEDASMKISSALEWSSQLRAAIAGVANPARNARGQVITFVGSKGGVGTTTLAVHFAHDYLRNHPDSAVCVLDLDVEKGDVSAVLEVRQGVSIADVCKVHQDLSATTVGDALIEHETGIHLMLAPLDVRDSEFVTPEALRPVTAHLRRDFSLIIIDAGGHVSPTQAAAVEMADEVVVVTTPDVLAVRTMRKRIDAWEALGVTAEANLRVVLNKVDKGAVFPPDAVAQLTTASVCAVRFPLAPRTLEAGVNARDPREITDAGWWKLLTRLRTELGLEGATAPGRRLAATPIEESTRPRSRWLPQRGAIALENAALIPLALVIGIAAWQFAVTGLASMWLGQATGLAARDYAITGSASHAAEAARDGVPEPFSSGIRVASTGSTLRVTVPIPASLLTPVGFPSELSNTREVVREP